MISYLRTAVVLVILFAIGLFGMAPAQAQARGNSSYCLAKITKYDQAWKIKQQARQILRNTNSPRVAAQARQVIKQVVRIQFDLVVEMRRAGCRVH